MTECLCVSTHIIFAFLFVSCDGATSALFSLDAVRCRHCIVVFMIWLLTSPTEAILQRNSVGHSNSIYRNDYSLNGMIERNRPRSSPGAVHRHICRFQTKRSFDEHSLHWLPRHQRDADSSRRHRCQGSGVDTESWLVRWRNKAAANCLIIFDCVFIDTRSRLPVSLIIQATLQELIESQARQLRLYTHTCHLNSLCIQYST